MPVSNEPVSDQVETGQSLWIALKTLVMLLVVILILSWLNQQSMSLYCQQKYHSRCELPLLTNNAAWRLGGEIGQAFGQAREAFFISLEKAQAPLVVEVAPSIPAVTVIASSTDRPEYIAPLETSAVAAAPAKLSAQAPVIPIAAAPQPARITPPAGPLSSVTLQAGDEVFFVGDSLMQGVAPHLANSLLKRFNIKSINLSKQSTGLAYPGFFNWPQTIQDTLQSHPGIRLIVVFMGPNDPWDMPDGRGKPFLRFRSEAWESVYRHRVQSILEQARQHNAQVIWVGPPNMNAPKLSTAMQYLRELYRSEAQQYQQIYLSANDVFGYQSEEFSFYQTDATGKKSKIRVDDGVHFTTLGQKLIATKVLSLIDVHNPGLTER